MKTEWQHIIDSAGQCPDLQQLELYHTGQLSDKERFAIEKHLLNCEMCADYIEGLSLISDAEKLNNVENEIKTHIHKLLYPQKHRFVVPVFYKRLAVAASFFIIVTTSFFVYYQYSSSTKQIAEQVKPIAKQPFNDKKTDSSTIKIVAQASDSKRINKGKKTLSINTNKPNMLADEYMSSFDAYNKLEETNQTPEMKSAPSSPSPIINDIALSKQNNTSTINGIVTDETGVPMPGVTVSLKGTTKGTTSDLNGQFSIPISTTDSVINLSYIGYKTETVAVTGKNDLKLALHPELLALDEVVVIGYGVQKKSMVTGSVSSVKEESKIKLSNKEREELLSQVQSVENKNDSIKLDWNECKKLTVIYLQLGDYINSKDKLNKLKELTQNTENKNIINETLQMVEKGEYKKALKKMKKLKQ